MIKIWLQKFIESYDFHPYSKLDKQVYQQNETITIKKQIAFENDSVYPIFLAASEGDLESIKR